MVNSQSFRENLSGFFLDSNVNDWQAKNGPLAYANKSSTLLETRMFNETPLNPLKCYDTLTKVLYLLLTKGESLTATEESNLFFSVTKLLQSNNDRLRRMFYLTIKKLKMEKGEAFIVISSLTKDMNSGNDARRANAIRVLSKIIDTSMATQIDRFLKAAIIDKSSFVASASLVCALKLWKVCPDLIRRWVNEITECVRSKNPTVQYHALLLLYEIKRNDRLALRRTISSLINDPVQNPLANCLVIRYAKELLESEFDEQFEKNVFNFLDTQLCSRSDLVVLEAAQALSSLVSKKPSIDFSSTLTALQILLGSVRPVIRFAAIRVLNQLAQHHAQHVVTCNTDIEVLLTDSNKYIAIIALTTLLKTSNENTVEKLVKQISALMNDVGDNFRLSIIKAVRQLALSYPSKHRVLLSFFTDEIREEASFDVKKDLVETISLLMENSHQAREFGLLSLCEYIEDCEYPLLCIKILTLLGDSAPKSLTPSKYIRFIYNRLILETPPVRASATHALANIAYHCPQLRHDIAILFESCLHDHDDEIRERMQLYFKGIQCAANLDPSNTCDDSFLAQLIQPPITVPLDALLRWVQKTSFNLATVPDENFAQFTFDHLLENNQEIQPTPEPASSNKLHAADPVPLESEKKNQLQIILSNLVPNADSGIYSHASPSIFITEREAEYSVQCIKHVFRSQYMLLEFKVTNTMSNQTLKNLEILMNSSESGVWTLCKGSKLELLCPEETESLYVVIRLDQFIDVDNIPVPTQHETFSPTLYFDIIEPETQQDYSDNYILETFVINIGDYFVTKSLEKDQLMEQWALLGASNEFSANYLLNCQNLETAVANLTELLHLYPVQDSSKKHSDKNSKTLLFSGTFAQGSLFLSHCSLIYTKEHGCILKIICRTKLKNISTPFLNIFHSFV